ncbi:cysteine hydrolase [Kribbia dieselivorans]|uniref:cysteine hydrolase n=1 Tax=Kribbia dieselivorans TaxID=331526 RepID=UPI000A47B139|nr:cysteine hydrolase [Kribbia dieselivorans]
MVGESIAANETIPNLQRLLGSADEHGFTVFVSPHYYFPTDQGYEFGGPIETMMKESGMFARGSQTSGEGFTDSGADWLDSLKPVIENGRTVVTSPHKVFGPATNDLILQLRKRGIQKIFLGGMLANLCVESHLRDLIENGFEVIVVSDAVAAPNHPEFGNGLAAANTNFGFIANEVMTTDEAVRRLSE